MLCCADCDYFKLISLSSESYSCNKYFCEYANFVFPNDMDELVDYPCNMVGGVKKGTH